MRGQITQCGILAWVCGRGSNQWHWQDHRVEGEGVVHHQVVEGVGVDHCQVVEGVHQEGEGQGVVHHQAMGEVVAEPRGGQGVGVEHH